jgi:benzoyl-CoA reductase/2-hydroxyglutaryl-CoA dehydratase subunit BcrC/BadD/HgdB
MTEFYPPSRREYLLKQKEAHGRHILGVFPAQYPREILWAMDVLPVEIWDPPLEIGPSNAHLQPYICSVVKLGLELILRDEADILDGLIFPHTCDSIQNLSSLVNDCLKLHKPCYFFYHPKAPYRDSSRRFYMKQLREFASQLEGQFGALDYSHLRQCVEQGHKVASVIRELYALRAKGLLDASNFEFYQVIRQGEFLHPDDFIPLLNAFLGASRGQRASETSVILSGVLPNPPEILGLLDELKIRVGDDDLLGCGRRLLVPPSQIRDPFESLAERYFRMPPCTTRNSPIIERLENILTKIEDSNARGAIFCMVKFCEPELFDIPHLIEGLKKKGLPSLVVDSELNQGLSGQLATRIEAFVEMIN